MQLAAKAAHAARQMNLATPFKNGIPGKDWIYGFMARHPELALRKPIPVTTVRARMLNGPVVKNYFTDLRALLDHHQPHKVWNMDETSSPLTHKPTKVLKYFINEWFIALTCVTQI